MNRYSRQTRFQPIGEAGQARLASAKVLIIGMGALGTASAEQLVRAGVGVVRIVDRDYVEWSNLQRQQLYTEEDARHIVPKAIAAKARLEAINSTVTIEAYVLDVDRAALKHALAGVNLAGVARRDLHRRLSNRLWRAHTLVGVLILTDTST